MHVIVWSALTAATLTVIDDIIECDNLISQDVLLDLIFRRMVFTFPYFPADIYAVDVGPFFKLKIR